MQMATKNYDNWNIILWFLLILPDYSRFSIVEFAMLVCKPTNDMQASWKYGVWIALFSVAPSSSSFVHSENNMFCADIQ